MIRVYPWVAKTSLYMMPYKHPHTSSAPQETASVRNNQNYWFVLKGQTWLVCQSKDHRGFMIKILMHYYGSPCSRHKSGHSFQGLISLNCNRISLNIHSVFCAFCPFWQEKVLLVAHLFNKEIPQRVFAGNIQKSTDSCCDGCSFLG